MGRSCVGVVLVGAAVVAGCGGHIDGGEASEAQLLGSRESVLGSTRSAMAYTDAVVLEPVDAFTEPCAGVLIAPRVVVTAAHCVVFVTSKTWKVTAPFATGGAQSQTARSSEPMDAAFKNTTRDNYAERPIRDVAVIYLDKPFEHVEYAVVAPAAFATDRSSPPTWVSAVGRSAEGLVLSSVGELSPPPGGGDVTYATARLSAAAGQSGGPLFVEGTQKLVGVHAHTDARGNDAWARLDGDTYTWLTQKVTSHGGWYEKTPR